MIALTAPAIRRLKTLLAEHPEESFVRVVIVSEGETTISHRITLERSTQEGDTRQDCDGMILVMDPKTAPRMDGVMLDYVETGDKPRFIFRHPEHAAGKIHEHHRN